MFGLLRLGTLGSGNKDQRPGDLGFVVEGEKGRKKGRETSM